MSASEADRRRPSLRTPGEPSEELKRLVNVLSVRSRDDFDLATFRDDFERFSKLFPPPPEVERRELRVGGVRCLCLQPPVVGEDGAVVYFHGGGYVSGSLGTHAELTAKLALAARSPVYLVDYRLAPEEPFPAALEDALAVLRGLAELPVPPRRLALAGDSAGGGLALAAMISLREAGEPLPRAAACFSPWVDLEATGESVRTRAEQDKILKGHMLRTIAELYLDGTDPRHPLASPLYGDLRGLPPLLIQVGTAEVLLDDAYRLAQRAREQGVAVELQVEEHLIHVWHLFSSLLPEGQQSICEAGAFLRRHLEF
ncbi:MAG: alpha/beta hydrolase [Acidobacteriota bacterium]|nr:alpha/beta hydrolase [Acidobacteriota bacterium]